VQGALTKPLFSECCAQDVSDISISYYPTDEEDGYVLLSEIYFGNNGHSSEKEDYILVAFPIKKPIYFVDKLLEEKHCGGQSELNYFGRCG
jgi:hypothetical protein